MRQKFPLREKDSHSDSHSEHAVNHWCCIKGRRLKEWGERKLCCRQKGDEGERVTGSEG